MARVQLYLRPSAGNPVFQFVRPGGHRDAVPALRLQTFVDLTPHVRPGANASRAALPACVIDTGSHLYIIPEDIWSQFRPGAVTPLPFDPAMAHSLRSVSLAGGNFPYELGELTIQLRDLVGGTLTVVLVAQFVQDKGKFPAPMILGLRGGVIDGRILRSEPDATAPFGQAWLLEDP